MTENSSERPRFGTRFGMLMTVIGAAVGLGNVWRFPYMVGKFGGAFFVLFYVMTVLLIGIPALMAEWGLGRHTQRGPVGAFERVGVRIGSFRFGKFLGWYFFAVVTVAIGYYTNALGWVLYYTVGEVVRVAGGSIAAYEILPPDAGFNGRSFILQITMTGLVIVLNVVVLLRGLRRGIETAAKILMPLLAAGLLVLIVRSLTLPGAWEGVQWYILKFDPAALTPSVMLAAMGQAIFSLSLGGSYMVIYGSYLSAEDRLGSNAIWTGAGDLGAGLLAGLAIIPAVIALGLEPGSGPGLLFSTLPEVFARIPVGGIFGLIFFVSLLGAAFMSDVGAFEVVVRGLQDNTALDRRQSVFVVAGAVFLIALPPMINMKIFVPWDLFFGTGMQTFGALIATLTFGWALSRDAAYHELGNKDGASTATRFLYNWIRYVIPTVILTLGVWWLLTDVLGMSLGSP